MSRCTFRQFGWTISLQMEHSISMRLNLSSSSPRVSSFPASLHTKHTAVWGRTGYNGLKKIKEYYSLRCNCTACFAFSSCF